MEVFFVTTVDTRGLMEIQFVSSTLDGAKSWMVKHYDICDQYDFVVVKQFEVDKDYDEFTGKSH